jgi:hypothetical protein
LAFGFEVEGDRPGLQIVDPRLWLEAARDPSDSPASSSRRRRVPDRQALRDLVGLISGVAVGRRERDLAVPMPVAAFVAALATGFLGGGLIVSIILAAGRQIGGP